jgi:hypothetical protein
MPDERLVRAVRDNYVRVGPELVEPLLAMLISIRQTLGDIDKFMILMVVALRSVAHPDFKARDVQEILAAPGLIPTLGTNTRSLADALSMPRETVRRKVAELIGEGWLVRNGTNLHYTREAVGGLAPVREKIIRLAASQYEAVGKLARGEA